MHTYACAGAPFVYILGGGDINRLHSVQFRVCNASKNYDPPSIRQPKGVKNWHWQQAKRLIYIIKYFWMWMWNRKLMVAFDSAAVSASDLGFVEGWQFQSLVLFFQEFSNQNSDWTRILFYFWLWGAICSCDFEQFGTLDSFCTRSIPAELCAPNECTI